LTADVLEGSGRWENGLRYAPEGCGDAAGTVDPCSTPTKTVSFASNPAVVEAEAFGVWAGDTCSTFGWQARDYIGRAKRLLLACQGKQVENEFWSGAQAQASGWPNPRLADPVADVVTPGAAVSPEMALRCLEQALAECSCGPGMIHATPQLVTAWAVNYLVQRQPNGQILTVLGTPVVAGAGYDGSSRDGEPQASGSVWAYGTGRVTVRLGDIEVIPGDLAQATDRENNTVTYRTERLAAVTFDPCCHVAARVDLELCAVGGS
jgi:hypothetical protein